MDIVNGKHYSLHKTVYFVLHFTMSYRPANCVACFLQRIFLYNDCCNQVLLVSSLFAVWCNFLSTNKAICILWNQRTNVYFLQNTWTTSEMFWSSKLLLSLVNCGLPAMSSASTKPQRTDGPILQKDCYWLSFSTKGDKVHKLIVYGKFSLDRPTLRKRSVCWGSGATLALVTQNLFGPCDIRAFAAAAAAQHTHTTASFSSPSRPCNVP